MLLASSELLSDFGEVRRFDEIRGVARITLLLASKFLTDRQVQWMQQMLTEMGVRAQGPQRSA